MVFLKEEHLKFLLAYLHSSKFYLLTTLIFNHTTLLWYPHHTKKNCSFYQISPFLLLYYSYTCEYRYEIHLTFWIWFIWLNASISSSIHFLDDRISLWMNEIVLCIYAISRLSTNLVVGIETDPTTYYYEQFINIYEYATISVLTKENFQEFHSWSHSTPISAGTWIPL